MNITRFLLLFAVLLVFCLALMAAMMAQYGYSLFAPEMRSMLLVAFLVAGYVSFRISRIIARRKRRLEDHPQPGGAGKSKLSGLFVGKSAAQTAREARVAARRKKLVEEGKLEDTPEPEPAAESEGPVRVAQSAPIKDRMAARAERVRRAKESGKLD
ncbi:MAG: hypothetical protein JJ954_05535 [Hyphomonas sp.]|uniref:hypothetical protein n=1 Tax=unclassified Hyphomonas TaxID=2630699 RepID=UPI001A8C87B5|nr:MULTISPECIES: hypothetical protein [unclassified Hyphomonas]MBO6582397.1 hypothetical protein [Hyphomonas sp.]QSR22278.1 hypothetical protein CFA77_08210 [Hyphomonas sp. KY3]